MLCGPQSAFDYACLASAGISSPRSEPPPALRGLLGRSRSAAAPWPARRHGEQLARQPGHGNFPTADIPVDAAPSDSLPGRLPASREDGCPRRARLRRQR